MKKSSTKDDGLKNLITIYREAFQLPENLNHYSEQDFKKAERQFVKFMLHTRDLSNAIPQQPVPQQRNQSYSDQTQRQIAPYYL